MLDDEFVELLRRQLNSEEERRVREFQQKVSELIADRHSKGAYNSSITLGLLSDLVIRELEETATWIANNIKGLYSNLGKCYRPALAEDLKVGALSRFDQHSRSKKVYLVQEGKKIINVDNFQKAVFDKFEAESLRSRNNLILSIDLYVASLPKKDEIQVNWAKERIKFVLSSIGLPVRIILIAYSILGALTFVRDEFFPLGWQKNPVISYLPHWSIQTWILVGLALFTVSFIEGAYRVARNSRNI